MNEQTRKTKSEDVVMLHAEIDELTASVASLTEEITELTKAVSELDAAVAKATSERTSEKEKNTVTIADAQAAQTAEATSFAQEPEVFGDEPYKGMGGESGGVVGMIEVIQSDFARLESETVTAETAAEKEYTQFMADTEVDKAAKKSDIDHAKSKKQNSKQALTEQKADLDGTQKELGA